MAVLIEKIPGGFSVDGLELLTGKCGCTSVLPCCHSWSKVKKTGDRLIYSGKVTGPATTSNFTWGYTVKKGDVTVEVVMEDARDKEIFSGYYPPMLQEWLDRGWELAAKDGDREDGALWRCAACRWLYKENEQSVKFEDLPQDWKCPVCNAGKDAFEKIG